jgi:single-stranded-DNA-specific exonuclease
VAGVNIRDALDSIATRHPGLIEKFGGHAMAAGLSLAAANLAAFKTAFAAEIAERADPATLAGVIHSDGALSAAELSLDTARVLRGAGPWGQGFPEPIFDGDFRILDARIVGSRHLKMQLEAADGAGAGCDPIEAIAFGHVGGASEDAEVRPGSTLRLAYRLEVNEYRGIERVQLNSQHLGIAAALPLS